MGVVVTGAALGDPGDEVGVAVTGWALGEPGDAVGDPVCGVAQSKYAVMSRSSTPALWDSMPSLVSTRKPKERVSSGNKLAGTVTWTVCLLSC